MLRFYETTPIIDYAGGWTHFPRDESLVTDYPKLIAVRKSNMLDATVPVEITKIESGISDVKQRLATRSTIYRRTTKFLKWLLVIVLLITFGCAYGLYSYVKSVPKQRATDIRYCSIQVGNTTVSGTREFSYNYHDYFGYRFIDTSKIDTKTSIDYGVTGLIIVGNNKDNFWSFNSGGSVIGKIIIKPAERYTFIVNGKVNVIDDSVFCK